MVRLYGLGAERLTLHSNCAVLTVTDKTFKEIVLENPLPVIVDFWAPWYVSCCVSRISMLLDLLFIQNEIFGP